MRTGSLVELPEDEISEGLALVAHERCLAAGAPAVLALAGHTQATTTTTA